MELPFKPLPAINEMNSHLPFVSYIMPTYNAERYLYESLKSIFSQDYPGEKYEVIIADGNSTDSTRDIATKFKIKVIINERKLAEYGKRLAFDISKGEIIVLLDSDNIIVGKDWLKEMVQPMLEDPTLLGVESNYLISKDFSSINTYANLLVIVDPLARILSSRPSKIEERGKYCVKSFSKGQIPVAGANGFLWKKSVLIDLLKNKEEFAETNILVELAFISKNIRYANVHGKGIYHYYSESFGDYFAKRRKIATKYLIRREKGSSWVNKRSLFYLIFSVIYLGSFIGPLLESLWNLIKSKRVEWLWHPVISFLTIETYARSVLIKYIRS